MENIKNAPNPTDTVVTPPKSYEKTKASPFLNENSIRGILSPIIAPLRFEISIE